MVAAGDAVAMLVDGCRWFGRAQSKNKRVGDGRGRVVCSVRAVYAHAPNVHFDPGRVCRYTIAAQPLNSLRVRRTSHIIAT